MFKHNYAKGAHTHTHMHAQMHARTHARTHTHTHKHGDNDRQRGREALCPPWRSNFLGELSASSSCDELWMGCDLPGVCPTFHFDQVSIGCMEEHTTQATLIDNRFLAPSQPLCLYQCEKGRTEKQIFPATVLLNRQARLIQTTH